MKIFRALTVCLVACVIGLILPVQLAAQSPDETKLIARAEQAISELTTLKAAFIQVSSDGNVGEGRVYFRRPHQLRLDYENPATLSIVTSRVWVYVDDKIDKFVQALPVLETPFAPLLSETVSFRSQDVKTSANFEDGIVSVGLEKDTGEGAGRLMLEFDASSWQLRRWVITDALGITTTVTLQNPIYGEKLANRLFGVPSYQN